MLLQETWQKGLQWDDNLPKDLKDAWENWCSEIEHLSELTAPEIEKAELYWIKQTQQSIFNREIDSLKREKSIEKDSKLYSLNPKLDENGLLVVTGRLQFSEFSQKEKHLWILPNGEKFTILLIQYAHKKVLHFGIASTLAHLREKYFITKSRKNVKSVLKNCIICKKFNAFPGKQEIAPLPKDRTVEFLTFLTCAVDFAGPIYIKTRTGSEKAYIVIFTCAATRAIHLEVATNLSTETFLLPFKRFISRRGLCKTIYSDNAKSFIKANKILNEVWSRISKSKVQQYFFENKIIWKFIIPRASWWGGFWERMVRSVKTPLKKILGRSCLN
ncbi:integrase catalytic domain-containing protein [Trichonephila clavata]|uniref:Integrase catalytic domain-containing protein n=1 Tax=Trichonephila clavata TaxID=2740835 RepID=A0A8X6FZN0_TRICU|nr:integrase catalytic domain-containing protein [Trichonephila clavata]